MKQKIVIIAVCLIIAFVFGMVFIYFSKINKDVDIKEDVSVIFSKGEAKGRIALKNEGARKAEVRVALVPFNQSRDDLPIYFYFDDSYPLVLTSVNAYLGLYNFLTSDLAEKNIQNTIQIVDAKGLVEKMGDGKSIIIMSSGILPDTVYSKDKNLVTQWLESGGIMFWLGDGFGYYSAAEGREIKDDSEHGKIGWEGQEKILGKNYLFGEVFEPVEKSLADTATQIAQALGLKYRYITTGAVMSELARNNASSIGFNKNINDNFGRSSISFIPVGKGRLILFGSGILEKQRDVSWDITQIISSNLIFASYPEAKYENVTLEPKASKVIDLKIITKDAKGATVLIFNDKNEVNYFYAKVFNNS